jgi:hypothetical protein
MFAGLIWCWGDRQKALPTRFLALPCTRVEPAYAVSDANRHGGEWFAAASLRASRTRYGRAIVPLTRIDIRIPPRGAD